MIDKLILFRFTNVVHVVVSRRRILDDSRRQGHRRSVANIQPGSALRFPRLQQRHSLVVVDSRSEVSRHLSYSASISIYPNVTFTDICSRVWQLAASSYSTSTSTVGITSTSNATEHPRATKFNQKNLSLRNFTSSSARFTPFSTIHQPSESFFFRSSTFTPKKHSPAQSKKLFF
jgi:hypothetical protein